MTIKGAAGSKIKLSSTNGILVKAKVVVIEDVNIEGTGNERGIVGFADSEYTVENSIFKNLKTGIFANGDGQKSTGEYARLTARGNKFTDVWAGIGGTEKTNLTAEGNTFVSIKSGGEGIGLGENVNVIKDSTSEDVSYLVSKNTFSYSSGNKVKDYRLE